jgi:hypothetical protein
MGDGPSLIRRPPWLGEIFDRILRLLHRKMSVGVCRAFVETLAGPLGAVLAYESRLRLCDDERARFQLAPVKYARPLNAAL